MECKHYWEIYEWEYGHYENGEFILHPKVDKVAPSTADVDPIKRGRIVFCKKCLQKRTLRTIKVQENNEIRT